MAMMTQKAYAERKGVTPQYINKLVSQRKIRLVAGKVDSRQADAAIKAFARSGRIIPAARKKAAKTPVARKKSSSGRAPARSTARRHRNIPVHDDPGQAPTPRLPGSIHGDATSSLTANRATREYYEAERARLDYEERMAKLLPAAAVLEAERRKNENIRTMFRRMPRGVAPLLARCANAAEVEDLLRREVDSILEQLARDPLGMSQTIAAAVAPSAELPLVPPASVAIDVVQEPMQ